MYNDGIHRFNPGSYQGRNWLLEQIGATPPKPQEASPPKKEEAKEPIPTGNQVWSWDGGGGDYSSPNSQSSNQGGYNNTPGAMVSPGGFSFGYDSSKGMQGAARGGILGGVPGMLGGLVRGITAQRTAPVFNSVAPSLTEHGRAMAAQETLDGILGNGFSPAERGPAPSNADIEASINGGGIAGGVGGWGDASSIGGASVDSGYDGSGYNGFYKGGKVTKDRLFGHNPPGKDDGAAFLDAGEHVTSASASKYYGDKFMSAINDKRIPKSKAMGLLKGL